MDHMTDMYQMPDIQYMPGSYQKRYPFTINDATNTAIEQMHDKKHKRGKCP